MFTSPSHLYLPIPEFSPAVYDYEQHINGIFFHTRVHQSGHTVGHYTAFVKPGERTPSFLDTICTILPDHSLECRTTISTHQYRQPLHVVHIPTPYPPPLLTCPPTIDPSPHSRHHQPGRDPPGRQPPSIPHPSHTPTPRVTLREHSTQP